MNATRERSKFSLAQRLPVAPALSRPITTTLPGGKNVKNSASFGTISALMASNQDNNYPEKDPMFSSLRKQFPILAGAACLALSAATYADTLEVPVGAQGNSTYVEQVRGLKQDEVTARLGEPLGIQGPVGEPAITRWEYPDFYVYFERDVALHTVKKHRG